MVITFEDVSFRYIEKKLLDQVNFSITEKDKIGVVGVNGTGKSTLLKLMMELEIPTSGQIIKSGGLILSYLPQEPHFSLEKSLLEIVLEDSTKKHPILEYEAKSILSKLGLNDYDITIQNLSGGQLRRLALAKALVSYSDILILDEPTNHLDNDMILWLESYLSKMKKGLIMVTHDRYFLQRVCNKMLELDFGKVYIYEANYETFLGLKAERMLQEQKSEQKLKSILKHEQEWLNRGVEARRTKSKSRIERFNELSKITFNETKEMNFSSMKSYLGKKLIEMKNGYKAFKDKILFENFSFSLQKSDIIGIVGENGAGKTTLFKILMQEEALDQGELILGTTLKIGYFSQHLELIDPEIRVIDYIKEDCGLIETLDGVVSASELLEQFLFDKEMQYTKVKMLSGGKKRRLQLIRVLAKNPNLLILDEPTNDLDIYTIEILENYIESFLGPVLIVSHDRYFLDKLCNKLFIFMNHQIEESMMSFSTYLKENHQNDSKLVNKKERGKENKLPASIRNEYQKVSDEISSLEKKIASLEEEIKGQTTDFHKIMELQEELDQSSLILDQKINRLFELEEIKEKYEKK